MQEEKYQFTAIVPGIFSFAGLIDKGMLEKNDQSTIFHSDVDGKVYTIEYIFERVFKAVFRGYKIDSLGHLVEVSYNLFEAGLSTSDNIVRLRSWVNDNINELEEV